MFYLKLREHQENTWGEPLANPIYIYIYIYFNTNHLRNDQQIYTKQHGIEPGSDTTNVRILGEYYHRNIK